MDENIMGKIVYKNIAAIICLLVVMLCISGNARADVQEAELFEKAYEYYLNYNPEKALENFDLFQQKFPDSSALDSVLFWRAKSLIQLKKPEEAARGFRKLREVFPESSYSQFAAKELETLSRPPQKPEKTDAAREKTVKASDADMPINEDRMRKLEIEKMDLEKQLSEAEKKRQLTEKGLSRALEDKTTLEAQLDELKRQRDEPAQKTAASEKADRERAVAAKETIALEARLKEREEKIRNLTDELARNDEKIALVTRELSGKIEKSQKDLEKLDLQIKELTAQNIALNNAVKEKDRAISDSHQTIASMKMSITESQASKQRELENANQLLSQLASEKVLLSEEAATEKKKSDELLARLREKEETLQRLLSEEAGRKAADAKAVARLKQSEAELARLQTEKTELQAKIKSQETRDQEKNDLAARAEEAKKLREEITRHTAELERLRNDNSRLLSDKTVLETSLRESQEQARRSALNMDTEAEKEKKSLLADFRELQKRLNDATEQVRQLTNDRQQIEAVLKERDQRLAKSQETVALLEKTLKGSEQDKAKHLQSAESLKQEKDQLASRLDEMKRIQADIQQKSGQAEKLIQDNRILLSEKREMEAKAKGYEEQIASLSAQIDRNADRDKERKDFAAALNVKEGNIREQQSRISKLAAEMGAMERELKEGREALAAVKSLRGGSSQLQAEVDQLKSQKQQMLTELDGIKRLNELQNKRNAELTDEVAALKAQALAYDKPYLRIGNEWYTLAAVMDEGMIAKSVIQKIQVKNIPWRTGNIIDDFVSEQILVREARLDTLPADVSVKESLAGKYALNAVESAYLDKYLSIERLAQKWRAVPAITEKEAKAYYDRHREQYLHGRESRIRVLGLKYGKADELEKSLVAVEMHGEALEGKPFDAIVRQRATVASMRETSLSRLPEWARLKLANLREGEISTIISTDDEFMIIQVMPSKPGYRSFEDVRKEIMKKLSDEQSGQKQPLDEWLKSQKKDVEFVR